MEKLLVTGGTVITPFEEMANQEILAVDGIIERISPAGTNKDFDTKIDAGGKLVVPGFVEIHVQGAGGADVLDGTPEALNCISLTCARFGVTGYLATTVYRPDGENEHLEVAASACSRELEGADLLGIHLEGPFIAAGKRGMIQPDCLAPVDCRVLEKILSLSGNRLRMMTIAPELEGALEAVGKLTASGVVASFGHSLADYQQTRAGFEAGIHHVTHLFNAMAAIHHRQPGPVAAIFEAPEVSAQVIPDGQHIHPAVLGMILRELGAERIVLISDGMQAMGLPEGRYIYNSLPYESKNGTARYLDGTLIGTALGMSDLVARFVSFTGCSRADAVRAASYNPARVLGLEKRRGSLEPGKDADFVLLDNELSVESTFKRGRRIFRAAHR